MIFVDTSAWYARFAKKDAHHGAIKTFCLASRAALVTTDYVVDETLTLFKARGNSELAFRVGPRLLEGELAGLVYVSPDDIRDAWRVFNSHRDKDWSFIDCTSYAVMKRLSVNEALATDGHFRQFGFAVVRP